MKYPVTITQVLKGQIEIEATSREEALRLADELYNRQGQALPDMEDITALTFSHTDDPDFSFSLLDRFIENEVPFRLEELYDLEVPDDVMGSLVEYLKDHSDIMFDYDRLDSFLLEKYDQLMEERQPEGYQCKACGEVIPFDEIDWEEDLWGHLQMNHEDIFEECQDWETPYMVEEYYEPVMKKSPEKESPAKATLDDQIQSAADRTSGQDSSSDTRSKLPEQDH